MNNEPIYSVLSIIYFFRLIPEGAENGAAREPCQRRRPTPKAYAEGLQEGEVPREGGMEGIAENAAARALSEAKAEGLQEGEVPREGGDSRGKRVGESIPDGWRPEASPPAGLCLCLCLSLLQTL